ncbi:MAG: menaquinone biosynthesis protein [Candidatus Eremiobacteraeota bacterium]|nr:menaquinone biosynthesis protein [Candidatus Eremiobacteraeota bacterium]
MSRLPLRFGVLSYVNCLPATLALELGEVGTDQLSLRRGTPAQLNEAVRTGELDVSVVSAAEYLQNPELYHRLEDIALWCDGPVRSVCLYSRLERDQLEAQPVHLLVTPESATSVALARILAKKSRTIPFTNLEQAESAIREGRTQGVLLIGDTALAPPSWTEKLQIHDLGGWWKDLTGHPMTYAVWVARRDLPKSRLQEARDILARSCSWGESNMEKVVEEAHRRSGLPRPELHRYLTGIRFRVTPESKAGYQIFKEKFLAPNLVRAGE